MVSKKNIIILLVLIYLIIYYWIKYIIGFNSNSDIKTESNLDSETKVLNIINLNQEQEQNQEQNQEKIESFTTDLINELVIKCESTLNIQTFESNTKCSIKINSDGSDSTTYNYQTKNIEGFENINLEKIKPKYPPIKTPRNIWVYWENINRTKYPTHIKLCLDTIKKHLGTKYNLVILNEKSIKEYLPDVRKDFDNLKVAQKVDYYRIALLYKYGGIWLDADIIMMSDLEPIFRKLDEGYDYVGFGCTGSQCSNGKFKPSNWILGARPQSVLMELVLQKLDTKLSNRDKDKESKDSEYHDYGKLIIWEALDDLKPLGYDYYHFTSEYDGTRDSNSNWVHTPQFFSTSPTKLLDSSKVMFMVLYNAEISDNKKLHWVRDCSDTELLYSKIWLGELYRKALGII